MLLFQLGFVAQFIGNLFIILIELPLLKKRLRHMLSRQKQGRSSHLGPSLFTDNDEPAVSHQTLERREISSEAIKVPSSGM